MKKIVIFLFSILFAMPPSPPPIPTKMPKECEKIPAMLLFMPPPLEVDLNKCKNLLNLPSKNLVNRKFKNVISIKPVEGFSMLYEIKTKNKTFYCNKDLSKCFIIDKWIK